MFAFVYSLILLTAEGAHAEKGGFVAFYEKYLNYPGFEAWKFINLAIFTAIIIYLVKKPLSDAFKAKREAIRAELIKAEEEKQAALSQLTSAEAKLVSLEAEKAAVLKKAKDEAAAEAARLANEAELEVKKMHEQTAGEITRLSQHTKAQLRKYSAEESIRLAEEKLRAKINADNDSRLVKAGIEAIGGMN
jgi:F-type H+-transporting ATPase subunit b